MTGYAVLPVGESALLVDGLASTDVLPLYDALRRSPGVIDLVPAESTLLVVFDPAVVSRAAAAAVVNEAWRVRRVAAAAVIGDDVVIPVRYDGPDLAVAAALLETGIDELVEQHTTLTFTAAFLGFVPGFAYLAADGDPLTLPRRDTPRTAVPAGSVALGGRYCGIYPRESPGGWHLIGSTDATLWDEHRDQPALLAPGTRVRFRRA
ncbi:allophanate hydrolase subunit 1 [Cnuibacter sp. UC19_7]|uniref:5-oxoprolinase subunit B family protein n=1 Tax=Cnuibacter sp. UC19_7 TaxID=3350166 RepID=UPI00366B407C